MKILKIRRFDKENIIVEVEGYEHAQPVFPADITPTELRTKLKEWKVNQDRVDEINANPPTPPTPPDISELKDLEGKEI